MMHMPASYTVLLIEDEAPIADTIEYALATEGFRCLICTTGAAGLQALAANPVDLVILDVGLPDCNGFQLFHHIRSQGDVPVIFLTARGEEVDRVVGLEIGADDYVTKPFSPRELSARVKTILRRAGKTASKLNPAAADFPFSVDEQKHIILFTGTVLPLARYEFKLLHTLIRFPGRVFTRAELMRRLWNDHGFSQDRTIDTHIKSIRAKLRAIRPDCDPIITHRGIGYALREDW